MTPRPVASVMTTEELLALPYNRADRWLIRGCLRERRDERATVAHRGARRIQTTLGWLLGGWVNHQPPPHGQILWDRWFIRLHRNPDTALRMDLGYLTDMQWTVLGQFDLPVIDAVPLLAVEIMRPKDTYGELHEKINEYLRAGVGLVWVLHPQDRTVVVYRPTAEPEGFNVHQDLSGDPPLPGFRVPVAQIFSR